MENSSVKCPVVTKAESRWPYYQYYYGDKDHERRRNGHGENHWSGAESLEWYTGKFVRDTMHGDGEYRWRYKGSEGTFTTYEGHFYGNRMHGYGVLSFPDGRVFNGLYYNNRRWGPGIESNTELNENVGLWSGNQLVRLTWRPKAPSVALDFNLGPSAARTMVEPYRILLNTRVREVGYVNSAIDLLKQSGAEPIIASENWSKLYPKHCNDLDSRLCHVALFEREYYRNKIVELEEINSMPFSEESNADEDPSSTYYAWNNSDMMISMMKHCFKHDWQRRRSGIELMNILAGLRKNYKYPGKHEYDCRNLILFSYLGYTLKVAELVNEFNVHPDVSDILGNTALMYAACGNQAQIIHFLVEAGANVNSFNDSCCTPLAVALLRYACVSKDVAPSSMVHSLIRPPSSQRILSDSASQEKPSEWHITRELPTNAEEVNPLAKTSSKNKLNPVQKGKSGTNVSVERKKTNADEVAKRKKTNAATVIVDANKPHHITPEEKLYNELTMEYLSHVTDSFFVAGKPDSYLFEVTHMAVDVETDKEDHKRQDKNKPQTHSMKVIKPSQDMIWRNMEHDVSLSSNDKAKADMLDKTMTTIVQLLEDGADPRLVRCPQSALWIAVVSGSADLVRELVNKGADINETYPEAHDYSVLDIAISRPLTYDNLALIRAILECGGTADHRVKCGAHDSDIPGPTLLHAVLGKHVEDYVEEEVCCQILELLLEYNANPLDQFKGCSATDMAMFKSMRFLDIFVRSPKTDLNAVINENNQTILVKMFSLEFFQRDTIDERVQTLTNLLLYGADPLLECQMLDKKYGNIFVFAKRNLDDMEPVKSVSGGKSDNRMGKKSQSQVKKQQPASEKPKKEDKGSKASAKPGAEAIADYKQALDLVKDCARILHARWIQAKLFKELLGVVEKYEHRQWNMILPEHRNKRACGIWLSMPRCLEIWDILKAKKKMRVVDRRILKHILCMVHFYCNRVKTTFKWPLTTEERDAIGTDVCYILREHTIAEKMTSENSVPLSRPYVTPEVAEGAEAKFQVCFDCALPLPEGKIQCSFCKQVSFCSLECMRFNIFNQYNMIHPCSENLKHKHFPSMMEDASVQM